MTRWPGSARDGLGSASPDLAPGWAAQLLRTNPTSPAGGETRRPKFLPLSHVVASEADVLVTGRRRRANAKHPCFPTARALQLQPRHVGDAVGWRLGVVVTTDHAAQVLHGGSPFSAGESVGPEALRLEADGTPGTIPCIGAGRNRIRPCAGGPSSCEGASARLNADMEWSSAPHLGSEPAAACAARFRSREVRVAADARS